MADDQNVSYKKMLRILPHKKRKCFLVLVKDWEKNSACSRYNAFCSKIDVNIYITQKPIIYGRNKNET